MDSALKTDAIFLLKIVYEKNPGGFIAKMDKLYHQFKESHQYFKLTNDQLKELAQLRRLHAVARQQVDSGDSSEAGNWVKLGSGRWVKKFTNEPRDVKTLSDLLREIEEDIKPLWKHFLSSDSDPLLEHDAEGERNQALLQDHMGQLGSGDALQQMIATQRTDLQPTE